MPPAASKQEAPAPLPDPFYEALEGLSKKYGIAIVAEGRPFPQVKHGPLANKGTVPDNGAMPENGEDPAQEEDMPQADKDADAPPPTREAAQDADVQRVANKYDYDAVRQGKVYLLQKRYTNPDDLPEVTPEELRVWLSVLPTGWHDMRNPLSTGHNRTEERKLVSRFNLGLLELTRSRQRITQEDFFGQVMDHTEGGFNPKFLVLSNDGTYLLPARLSGLVGMNLMILTQSFYFQSHEDRVWATQALLENSRPLDPVFHWQTLGQFPVFGYDTQFHSQANPLFIPASDCDRIVVVPYGTPLPHSNFWMRTEPQLPDPDPTDPKTLSPEAKRFLDDNGKSSRAVTIAEALTAVNKKVPKQPGYKIYQAAPMYASKRVTLVGTDKISPETLIQSMAAVYGLGVVHRRDDHVVLGEFETPSGSGSQGRHAIVTHFLEFDKYARTRIPAPIYRAMHARFLAGRTKVKNEEGPRLLEYETQYEFQRLGATFRNAAMRQFRYLAEPKVKAQPKERLALSRLGERERMLFVFAQTVAAYADNCQFAEIPLPPYVTHIDDFRATAKITGGVYLKGDSPNGPYIFDKVYFSKMTLSGPSGYSWLDDTARLALFITYVNPETGYTYGPVQFLDVSLYLPDLE
jgi:hypothetical protein